MHALFLAFADGVVRTGDVRADMVALLTRHGHPETADHCLDVATEARRLAHAYGVDETHAELAGWLHDISAIIPAGTRATLPGYEWLREHVITPERVEKAKRLQPLAADLGCSMAQMALAWCLKNPNVSTVITGASRREQVVENMKALEVVPKLTSDVLEMIEGILGNKPQ